MNKTKVTCWCERCFERRLCEFVFRRVAYKASQFEPVPVPLCENCRKIMRGKWKRSGNDLVGIDGQVYDDVPV